MLHRLAEGFAGGRVPDHRRLIHGGRHHPLAIGAELRGKNLAIVASRNRRTEEHKLLMASFRIRKDFVKECFKIAGDGCRYSVWHSSTPRHPVHPSTRRATLPGLTWGARTSKF
jgi:hypothetical protein